METRDAAVVRRVCEVLVKHVPQDCMEQFRTDQRYRFLTIQALAPELFDAGLVVRSNKANTVSILDVRTWLYGPAGLPDWPDPEYDDCAKE